MRYVSFRECISHILMITLAESGGEKRSFIILHPCGHVLVFVIMVVTSNWYDYYLWSKLYAPYSIPENTLMSCGCISMVSQYTLFQSDVSGYNANTHYPISIS